MAAILVWPSSNHSAVDFALTSQTRIASARTSRYRSRTGDVAEWLKATVC